MWDDLGCLFYEEPVNALNPDLQGVVTHNLKVPIAAGERIYTRWGYRKYFELNALAVIQPDLGLVGGISEGKKIATWRTSTTSRCSAMSAAARWRLLQRCS